MRFLAAIGALAIIVAIGAAVFFFGGFFNVSAVEPDPKPVAWALQKVRTASIDRHAKDTPTVSLEDATVVQAGAKAFAARGCGNCHGGPGVAWAKFSEGLRPDPPDLKDIAGELEPRELFYVIKNGINMTGMPSFGPHRSGRPRNLDDRRLRQEAADGVGSRLQELDRSPGGCTCRRACGEEVTLRSKRTTSRHRRACPGDPDRGARPCFMIGVAGTSPAMTADDGRLPQASRHAAHYTW